MLELDKNNASYYGGAVMKRSRMGIKRNRRKNTFILVMLFCIVLPAIAIYAGLKLTEKVMIPVLNGDEVLPEGLDLSEESLSPEDAADEEEDPIEVEKKLEIAEIKPLSIYTIQVASLNDTQNADVLIADLNSAGLPNLVYKIDNSYKVYTMGATSRSIIEENIGHIKEYYPDAYISDLSLPAKGIEFDANASEAKMKDLAGKLNELIDSMEVLSVEWNNLIQKRGEKGQYVELLKKQQTLLEEINIINNEAVFPSSFQKKSSIEKMLEFQVENLQQSLALLEASGDDVDFKVHSLYLDSLFRIVEVVK